MEPRVRERDAFVVTLWTYYEPVTQQEIPPANYADALVRLHAGMRTLDLPAPHFTDRVEQAQRLVASRDRTPALADSDRGLLDSALRGLRRVVAGHGGAEQLLHGEPHPGNVLATEHGPLSSTSRRTAAVRSSSTSRTRPTRSRRSAPVRRCSPPVRFRATIGGLTTSRPGREPLLRPMISATPAEPAAVPLDTGWRAWSS
ncbi:MULTISPECIES: phosphotransferase [Saccharothrix]|uniref:phosphotransferase n=1 Tax=Saccharothrix TaxID=2071 RepID=UPI000A7C3E02|nr:phosphotransferase [Saccharothrix sp. CB00851]